MINETHLIHTNNPLITAAFPLLLLFIRLKQTPSWHTAPCTLRKTMITAFNTFSARAKALHCESRLILVARYCLCTALDEAILLTPWGNESGWAQHSLLSVMHQETWGGERFFILLDKMASEPQKNLFLLELLYLLLALGFEGKYYNQDKTLQETLQHRLYRLIMAHYLDKGETLSPSLSSLDTVHPIKNGDFLSLKFFGCMIGVLFSVGLLLNIFLYNQAKPLLTQLSTITLTQPAFIPFTAAPPSSAKLKYHSHLHLLRDNNHV